MPYFLQKIFCYTSAYLKNILYGCFTHKNWLVFFRIFPILENTVSINKKKFKQKLWLSLKRALFVYIHLIIFSSDNNHLLLIFLFCVQRSVFQLEVAFGLYQYFTDSLKGYFINRNMLYILSKNLLEISYSLRVVRQGVVLYFYLTFW